MHLIQKTVANRFTYYWNHQKQQWEGLRANATKYQDGVNLDDVVAGIIEKGKAKPGEIRAIKIR